MDAIEIHDPDPTWPARFDEERIRLEATFSDDAILAIEHFGSTAIPGLAAKPVIDILVAVPSLDVARDRFEPKLRALGYVFWSENPKTDRLFFVKGLPPHGDRRTHHVHVTERPGALWDQLRFRDYLRAHHDEAQRYEALKREAAETFGNDREAYTQAKTAYMERIMGIVGTGC